jgi:hypothetical protein
MSEQVEYRLKRKRINAKIAEILKGKNIVSEIRRSDTLQVIPDDLRNATPFMQLVGMPTAYTYRSRGQNLMVGGTLIAIYAHTDHTKWTISGNDPDKGVEEIQDDLYDIFYESNLEGVVSRARLTGHQPPVEAEVKNRTSGDMDIMLLAVSSLEWAVEPGR